MNVRTEQKQAEALRRLRAIGIYGEVIRAFEADGTVEISEPPWGACFYLNESQKKRVSEFEYENDALVYHVIYCRTNLGELENYLFVSDYTEEWNSDMDDIKRGCPIAFVNNLTYPDCSEFGYIGTRLSSAAGLERSW